MGFLGQKMAAMMAVVVCVAMMAAAARGQTASCASKLVPCGQYLNSTNPPESCCGPLKETVKNELSCLCALYKSPEILKAFNITVDKALELSRHCGINSNLTACDTGALAPASNPPPPASSGGAKSAHRATWFGATGLTGLFFFWWSILA